MPEFDLTLWCRRIWVVMLIFATAQLIRAVVDALRLVQAIRIHGWGG